MTIKEVSTKMDLTNDTLRYYERVGLIGPIKKTTSGIRDYDEADLRRIEFVKCMRAADLPIEVLVKYMQLFDKGDNTIKDRIELLKNQRVILKDKIEEMNKALERLNYKIDLYSKDLKKGENK